MVITRISGVLIILKPLSKLQRLHQSTSWDDEYHKCHTLG